MEMVVESIMLHIGPKSSIGVKLGWDLVTVKAVAFYSHHFHTRQTIQWALMQEVFYSGFSFNLPLTSDTPTPFTEDYKTRGNLLSVLSTISLVQIASWLFDPLPRAQNLGLSALWS